MKPLPENDPGTPDHRSPARYLLWLLRAQRRSITAGAALGVVWMLSQALMPAAIGRAIGAAVAARDEHALLAWSGVLLGLGVVQAVTGPARHRFAVFNWLAAAYRTVQLVTRQATRLGGTLPKRLSAGEVVSIGLSDVAHIGDVLDIVARGSGAVVGIVVVAGILLSTSAPLGLIVLVGVPLIRRSRRRCCAPTATGSWRTGMLVGELSTHATDLVAGLRILRGIGGEALFSGRYRTESQRVRAAGVAVARAETRMNGAEAPARPADRAGHLWRPVRRAGDDRRRRAGRVLRLRGVPDRPAEDARRGRKQDHQGPGRGGPGDRAPGHRPRTAGRRNGPPRRPPNWSTSRPGWSCGRAG